MSSYVYLLLSSNGSTYIGATVNLCRRLDQHNKLLSGGAKATGMKVEKGETWIRVAHIKNFPDWKSALQFEWRWKQINRKIYKKIPKYNLKRCVEALKILINLKSSTTKAIPFCDWENPLEVVCEDVEFRDLFSDETKNV